jgi:hypothetical protein
MSGLLGIGVIVLVLIILMSFKKNKRVHEGSTIRYQISRD